MAYFFGDSFDLYSTINDPIMGYWDGGNSLNTQLVAGRFTGGQALSSFVSNSQILLSKSSPANDAVHHITCAYRQTFGLGSTNVGIYLQLSDGTTNQCCIVFRWDGAILLQSGTVGGTTLATYAGAVSASNVWFAFEFEVVINNATGSFKVRKNGNTTDDHSTTNINTRPGTNSYANQFSIGVSAGSNSQNLDDLLWRSDAASVPWIGDVRSYTRRPANDVSIQFARSMSNTTFSTQNDGATASLTGGLAYYTPFTPPYDGTIGSLTFTAAQGGTGVNIKFSIFASSGGVPSTVLGSANVTTSAAVGNNTVTFPTPVAVSKGVQYWFGMDADTYTGIALAGPSANCFTSVTPYASFPAASPTPLTASRGTSMIISLALTTNYGMVSETLQDGLTTYVYDLVPGHADLYGIAPSGQTPNTVVAVVTRGFVQKNDAGNRSIALQMKSGSTTVASPTLRLGSNFQWTWRADTVDPNTSAAWTAAAVDSINIGPLVVS